MITIVDICCYSSSKTFNKASIQCIPTKRKYVKYLFTIFLRKELRILVGNHNTSIILLCLNINDVMT